MNNLVSFLIAAFNEEKFIGECIESCLNQTYKNIEIIIVNDGSTDRTSEIANSFLDPRIKVINFPTNKGKVAAFNEAFRISTGDYFCIVGADDVNYEYRVEISLSALRQKRVDLIAGNLDVCDAQLNTTGVLTIDHQWTIYELMIGNKLPGGASLFNKSIANKIFPIPESLKFEDWWIAFITHLHGSIATIEQSIVKYRQHSDNDVGLGGSGRERRLKDWKRHDACYYEFERYLDSHHQESHKKLLAHLRGCRLIKSCYLEPSISKRLKSYFTGDLPKYLSWKLVYFFTLFFGAAGYDFLLFISGRSKSS